MLRLSMSAVLFQYFTITSRESYDRREVEGQKTLAGGKTLVCIS